MTTYISKQYNELDGKINDNELDGKINDIKLYIIQLLSEIQEYDNELNDKENYLKHMNSKVNKCEKKLSDMGIIKQSNYLKTYLTEEQINNVINICNDDGMIWEGEDVD